jgi:hypothetical protein
MGFGESCSEDATIHTGASMMRRYNAKQYSRMAIISDAATPTKGGQIAGNF